MLAPPGQLSQQPQSVDGVNTCTLLAGQPCCWFPAHGTHQYWLTAEFLGFLTVNIPGGHEAGGCCRAVVGAGVCMGVGARVGAGVNEGKQTVVWLSLAASRELLNA
jgi:hypothetical protein